jgi:predicted peptidase
MIHRRLFLCALILSSTYISSGPGKQLDQILIAKTFHNTRDQALPYRLYVPRDYDQSKKYPLVLFLHGGGGVGTDNLTQIQGGNGALINMFTRKETQSAYPCFVVAPQAGPPNGWLEYDYKTPSPDLLLVLDLLVNLRDTFSIDTNRLYIVGQSLGGYAIYALVARQPALFAAAVPICGGGDPSQGARLASVPFWVFHGAKDETVEVQESRRMVAAIRKTGGNAQYTEYAGEGHLIWQRVVGESRLLPWIFSQTRHK